jgi:hypothetical protein
MTDTGTVGDGPSPEERDARLSDGASALAGRSGSLLRNPHLLLATSATLMTVGIVCIVLAWIGIARSTMVEEQMSYLVSGGLLGLALTVVGALTFFSHWITVLIRQNREQIELLREMKDRPREEVGDGSARSTAARRPVRRAPRGS